MNPSNFMPSDLLAKPDQVPDNAKSLNGVICLEMLDKPALIAHCKMLENFVLRLQSENLSKYVEWSGKNGTSRQVESFGRFEETSVGRSCDKDFSQHFAKSMTKDFGRTQNSELLNLQKRKWKFCTFCRQRHERGYLNCPSYGSCCEFCGKFNHDQRACWLKYPKFNRFQNEKRKSSVSRNGNDLRKSFSAPEIFAQPQPAVERIDEIPLKSVNDIAKVDMGDYEGVCEDSKVGSMESIVNIYNDSFKVAKEKEADASSKEANASDTKEIRDVLEEILSSESDEDKSAVIGATKISDVPEKISDAESNTGKLHEQDIPKKDSPEIENAIGDLV